MGKVTDVKFVAAKTPGEVNSLVPGGTKVVPGLPDTFGYFSFTGGGVCVADPVIVPTPIVLVG